MSHAATNWAIQQRGLKPTTKIVLWHLCDRFNPDFGCFPSQEQLAEDCEISRSTLNEHLAILETASLIRRVQRLNPGNKRQMPTRYILAFEPGFTQDRPIPCPETGHGDTVQDALPFVPRENATKIGASPVDNLPPCPKSGRGAVSDFDPEPCPENAPSRVRNPDSNLVRERASVPAIRTTAARVSASGGAKAKGWNRCPIRTRSCIRADAMGHSRSSSGTRRSRNPASYSAVIR